MSSPRLFGASGPKAVYHRVVDNFLAVVTVPLAAAALLVAMARFGPDELACWLREARPVHIFVAAFLPAAASTLYLMLRPRAVYLVDYACFRTPPSCRVPFSTFLEHAKLVPAFDEHSIRFMARLLERSGLGEETCLPPAHHYIPPYDYCTLDAAREEAELVVFSAIDDLFAKTTPGVVSRDAIGIVVVNCTIFCPAPSLVDTIVNRYKLRSDVRGVNLSGMGCSAGLVAVGLARSLLRVAPRGTHALVVSTETMTGNFYVGSERSSSTNNFLFGSNI